MVADIDPRIPIIISVTGHRDIPANDTEAIQDAIRKFFHDEITESYKNSPVYLLSALAEGADMLAAETILEEEINGNLIILLPYDETKYIDKFSSANKIKYFSLKEKAVKCINVAELYSANDLSEEMYYELTGTVLAQHCHVLLAIWDGKRTDDKIGGTGATVSIKQGMRVPKCFSVGGIYDLMEAGPVYHIQARRNSNRSDIDNFQLFQGGFLNDDTTKKKLTVKTIDYIEKINKIIKKLMNRSIYNSFEMSNNVFEKYFKFYDMMALSYRNKYNITVIMALLASVIVTSLFIVYEKNVIQVNINNILIEIVVLLLCLLFIAYLIYKPFNVLDRYMYIRVIAESYRVQMYWDSAGIKETVVKQYLYDEYNNIEWIKKSLWINWLIHKNDSVEKDYNYVYNMWIQGQYKYYKDKYENSIVLNKNNKYIKLILLYMSVLSFLIFVYIDLGYHIVTINSLYFKFTMSFSLLGMGICQIYYDKRMAGEYMETYRRMCNRFDNMSKYVGYLIDKESASKIEDAMMQLGIDALRENIVWLKIRRTKPPEVAFG